jgi:hypothetical protein
MWPLISPRAKRISSPEKFWSSPQKDFFNTIGGKADIGQGKRELPLENLPMLVRCRDIQVYYIR